jgi:DNA-binding MarR family transcriptional regulator
MAFAHLLFCKRQRERETAVFLFRVRKQSPTLPGHLCCPQSHEVLWRLRPFFLQTPTRTRAAKPHAVRTGSSRSSRAESALLRCRDSRHFGFNGVCAPSFCKRQRELAVRIQHGLKEGRIPLDSLYDALCNSTQWERDAYLRAFAHHAPVLALPDLTARQKDALIALRYAGTSSLQQLTRILALDRSYTRRLLDTLVEKGYAVKYFRRGGAHYLAVTSPLSDDSKRQVTELMDSFKEALFEKQEENKAPEEVSDESIKSTKSQRSRESHKSQLSPESRQSSESPESSLSTKSPESLDSATSNHTAHVPYPATPGRNSNATGALPVAHPPHPP